MQYYIVDTMNWWILKYVSRLNIKVSYIENTFLPIWKLMFCTESFPLYSYCSAYLKTLIYSGYCIWKLGKYQKSFTLYRPHSDVNFLSDRSLIEHFLNRNYNQYNQIIGNWDLFYFRLWTNKKSSLKPNLEFIFT